MSDYWNMRFAMNNKVVPKHDSCSFGTEVDKIDAVEDFRDMLQRLRIVVAQKHDQVRG